MKSKYTFKESPIIFNTEMVRATTEGRKTQTRRVIKKQPDETVTHIHRAAILDGTNRERFLYQNHGQDLVEAIACPYGQKGDLIWVRETHVETIDGEILYRAIEDDAQGFAKDWKWKPSIHLRKDAARIWLRVKDVRIERVSGISEEDAIAEGIENVGGKFGYVCAWHKPKHHNVTLGTAQTAFQYLWKSIYGPHSWDVNPWTWVIEFEVLSLEGKPEYYTGKQLRIDEESERNGNGKVYMMPAPVPFTYEAEIVSSKKGGQA